MGLFSLLDKKNKVCYNINVVKRRSSFGELLARVSEKTHLSLRQLTVIRKSFLIIIVNFMKIILKAFNGYLYSDPILVPEETREIFHLPLPGYEFEGEEEEIMCKFQYQGEKKDGYKVYKLIDIKTPERCPICGKKHDPISHVQCSKLN